jgi:hypothetical protein
METLLTGLNIFLGVKNSFRTIKHTGEKKIFRSAKQNICGKNPRPW